MKVPNIRFNLKFFDDHGGEVVVRTIEDLKNNLNVSDLYAYMMDGTLTRWLRSLQEPELAEHIEKARGRLDIREKVQNLLKAFDADIDQSSLDALVSAIAHQDNRVAVTECQERVRDTQGVECFTKYDGPYATPYRSERSYSELIESLRRTIRQYLIKGIGYGSDPSFDIGELVAYHRKQYVEGRDFINTPEAIPFLYLDFPELNGIVRFEEQWAPYTIDADMCVACEGCISACPCGAISGDGSSALRINDAKCVSCGMCAEACPAEAISGGGEWQVVVDDSMKLSLPVNCCVGSSLPKNGRWIVTNELYLKG